MHERVGRVRGPERHKQPAYYERLDESFIEPTLSRFLEWATKKLPTQILLEAIDHRRRSAWGGEEFTYLLFLALSVALLSSGWATVPGRFEWSGVWLAWLGVSYSLLRIVDIVSYELRVVLVDPKKPLFQQFGHVLSANRRVLLGLIRIVEFIAVYALLHLALQRIFGADTFGPALDSPVSAFYQSLVTAVFVGMTANPPDSDWARLFTASEILIALILVGLVLAMFVASIGPLREISPRPLRRGELASRNRSNMRLTVVSVPLNNGGYSVTCPAIPGCVSQGDSLGEALANIREAIVLCLEVRTEDKLPAPSETPEMLAQEIEECLKDLSDEGLPLTLSTHEILVTT